MRVALGIVALALVGVAVFGLTAGDRGDPEIRLVPTGVPAADAVTPAMDVAAPTVDAATSAGNVAGPEATLARQVTAPVEELAAPPAEARAATTAPLPRRAPPPGVTWHEPAGFETVIDEDWSSFDRYGWWHTRTNEGNAEIRDGRLVWTYPEGKKGGSVPGAKIVVEQQWHGPYQYHRDEGVTLSENFHGHRSSVNKFRYFNDARARGHSPVGFFGADQAPLTIGINTTGWTGPHHDSRLRWNYPGNLASPTREQALFTRGEPHTIETLLYIGTPGRTDGWLKLWLDGVLILHVEELGVVPADERAMLRGVHFAPVWGGTQDVVPQTQTLSVDYSYVSAGEAIPQG